MNTSLEPEAVLLTWRSGDSEDFLGDSVKLSKATSEKSRNFFAAAAADLQYSGAAKAIACA